MLTVRLYKHCILPPVETTMLIWEMQDSVSKHEQNK